MENVINFEAKANQILLTKQPAEPDFGEAGFNCVVVDSAYRNPNDAGHFIEVPDSKFIIREDTGRAFKAVGLDYQLVNHSEAFKTAEKIIHGSGLDTTDMTREFKISHEGARAFAYYRFPMHQEEIALNDTIELQLLVRNSVDGSMRFCIEYGALRLACLNGMTALGSIGKFKRKHTKYLNIHDAIEPLTNVMEVYNSSVETWKRFTTRNVSDAEAIKIIADAVATPDIKKFIINSIDSEFNGDVEHCLWHKQLSRAYQVKDVWGEYKKYRRDLGANLWGVYNALTHWSTHAEAYKETSQPNIEAIKNDRRTAISKTADAVIVPMLEEVA